MTDPLASLNAALAEHYVIDRELGRGGMATVYLARDLKHERFVALKTLRPEIALALGRDRFLREIKLAARLQHPTICPVYDSGDAAGTLYYVMPYVEGESLRDRLARDIQLPIDDALQIAREVADALTYAHSHDVVHRDIKPENIMMSGGHAIVTDFGIARAITEAGGDKLTETGLAIGTPAYMSPEQAAGTGHVDRRSDIYSLACVVYETLAGQPPFTGPTAQAIMARHSLDSVPRLKIVREAIPDALENVLKQALAKVPADRYQTAQQFADAMTRASTGIVSPATEVVRPARPGKPARRWPVVAAATIALLGGVSWVVFGGNGTASRATTGLDPRRMAVLYFDDLSRDSSLRYLADGLTEGLIDQLAQVRTLEVVSRNGVAPFRAPDIPRDSVARALQVGTLIVGSVETAGVDRLRVTTRLVDGGGAEYDRRSFELPHTQVFAITDTLARDIARFLRSRLGEELELRGRRASTNSADAWALVQRAERARKDAEPLLQRDRATAAALLAQADTLLAQAERTDSRWAEPVILRGWVALDAARAETERDAQVREVNRGLVDAERAMRLDPSSARARHLRGTLRYALWRREAAPAGMSLDDLARQTRQDLEDAVRADPGLAAAHETLSLLLHYQKDIVSSVLAARKAYEADAYLRNADGILTRLFHSSYNIMQFAEARRWCGEGARRFPADYRFVHCDLMLLVIPGARADVDRAWELAARVESMAPDRQRAAAQRQAQIFVGGVIGRAGLKDSARHVLVRARGDHAVDPTQELVGYEAAMRALMGDADTAITLLKRYVAANPAHSFEVGGDIHWWWRDLREHAEFSAVMGTNR